MQLNITTDDQFYVQLTDEGREHLIRRYNDPKHMFGSPTTKRSRVDQHRIDDDWWVFSINQLVLLFGGRDLIEIIVDGQLYDSIPSCENPQIAAS